MPLTVRHLCCTMLVASLATTPAQAEPTAQERTHLAGLLRQLDAMVRQVTSSAALPTDEHPRFTFDYARLSADLELVRQGIEGYLTPARAQPRSLPELTGHYTLAGETLP